MQPKPQSLRDLGEYPILYVDDEPDNLRVFDLTFRNDFQIFTAESGSEGLEIINTRPVALVLSDHRMPSMTGNEFLARVSEIDPKTIRIMVTAYGDAETLRDAINDGSIYHFIPKPWEPEEVRATLVRAIEAYALERERSQLLREMTVLNRVSRQLNDQLQPGHVLEVLVTTVREQLQFDGACVLLVHPESGELRLVSAGNHADQLPFDELAFRPDAVPELFAALHAGRSQSLRQDQVPYYAPPLRRWVTELAADEILVTPLFGKEGLIGALAVDNRSGRGPFTGDDGTLIDGLCNQASIALENARLMGELRLSRQEARRSERYGEAALLAAELAGEMDGPLEDVRRFLDAAPGERTCDEASWQRDYDRAASGLERVRDLTLTLRSLSRVTGPRAAPEQLDLRGVVAAAVPPLRREARLAGVELVLEMESGLPKLVAVREQMRALVQHLVLNALEVTPSGGSIRVEAARAGDHVRLDVSDTGPGVPAEHLERIFDPFFTTKNGDDGIGLGLVVCHRIVSDHGGSIEVRSEAGQGTCFSVKLPLESAARSV